jgi:hypothetical protein
MKSGRVGSVRAVFALAITSVALIAAWMACRSEKTIDAPKASLEEKPAAPTKTIDPTTTATISGTVTYSGALPAPTKINARADAACAKEHPTEFDAGDVAVNDGKVENAFVWVKTGLEEYQFPPPAGALHIDQKGCMYHPRIFGARTGQELEFANSDPTLHNIDAKPTKSSGFNFVTPQGQKQARSIKKPEVMVKIGCDVHPWMRAYAGVLDHPFFQVTGRDGRYALRGLPPGAYTIGVWHERLGQSEQQIAIAPKESKMLDLALPAK